VGGVLISFTRHLWSGAFHLAAACPEQPVVSKDPKSKLMAEEIFGPVLTIYVYPENEYDQTLHVCDQTSPYALTGSIFALDRGAIVKAMDVLRHAAGNFYVNDKPTGAVVLI
jgi:1-pyrroline-5-carboxylate dehydrogenase